MNPTLCLINEGCHRTSQYSHKIHDVTANLVTTYTDTMHSELTIHYFLGMGQPIALFMDINFQLVMTKHFLSNCWPVILSPIMSSPKSFLIFHYSKIVPHPQICNPFSWLICRTRWFVKISSKLIHRVHLFISKGTLRIFQWPRQKYRKILTNNTVCMPCSMSSGRSRSDELVLDLRAL